MKRTPLRTKRRRFEDNEVQEDKEKRAERVKDLAASLLPLNLSGYDSENSIPLCELDEETKKCLLNKLYGPNLENEIVHYVRQLKPKTKLFLTEKMKQTLDEVLSAHFDEVGPSEQFLHIVKNNDTMNMDYALYLNLTNMIKTHIEELTLHPQAEIKLGDMGYFYHSLELGWYLVLGTNPEARRFFDLENLRTIIKEDLLSTENASEPKFSCYGVALILAALMLELPDLKPEIKSLIKSSPLSGGPFSVMKSLRELKNELEPPK